MADTARTDGLEVRRSRSWPLLWLLAALAAVGVAAWFVTHPRPLATPDVTVTATTPVGDPVYVGVLAAPGDSGRTLAISDVRVSASGDGEAAVVVLVCRDGALSVTTEPQAFCDSLVEAEGGRLGPGDQLVLEVTGRAAGTVELAPARVTYRDGVQWATQDAGPPVRVTVLDR